MVNILFCTDSLTPNQPDAEYASEVAIAEQLKLPYALLHLAPLLYHGDVDAAVADVPLLKSETLTLYRGWPLKPDQYNLLYNALWERGWTLINRPDHYRHAHYLPNYYSLLREHTPRSAWVETGIEVPIGDVMALMELFDKRPVVIRDYAQAQKFYWKEAFYLPNAADETMVAKRVRRFMELSHETLSGGLVVREYIPLEPLGLLHASDAQPLYKEFRSFWLHGQLVYATPIHGKGNEGVTPPKWDEFQPLAEQFPAPFLMLDVAKRLNSHWIVMEADDGQVAPLPPSGNAEAFYRQLIPMIKKGAGAKLR